MYLNGRYLDGAQASVSIGDRGFLFGDGVYEVTRSVLGELFEVERHLRRFTRSLAAVAIPFGADEVGRLPEISRTLLHEQGLDGDATVYWQVTRGAAPRTHAFPPSGASPTVLVSASPLVVPHALRTRGATAITVPDIRWARCDIKSLNLLPNVLAKQRAVEAGADEPILVRDGVVTEGGATSVFAVLDGILRTYPLSNYILPGVTREVVLELARALGLAVLEEPVLVEELKRASEVFYTSTTNDVMPVVRVDGRVVGVGRPGPIASQLQVALAERMSTVAAQR